MPKQTQIFISLLLLLLTGKLCTGQAINIKGTVIDDSGKGVPEAIVSLEGLGYHVSTDTNGKFHLSNISSTSTNAHRYEKSFKQ